MSCVNGTRTEVSKNGTVLNSSIDCGTPFADMVGPLQCLLYEHNHSLAVKIGAQLIISLVIIMTLAGNYPEIVRRLVLIGTSVLSFNGSIFSPGGLIGIVTVVCLLGDGVFNTFYATFIENHGDGGGKRGSGGRFSK